MTLAVVLALGASVGWGSSDFLGGARSRALGVLPVLAVSQAMSLLLLTAILLGSGAGPPPPTTMLVAAAAGLGEVIGIAALYRGLARGVTSVVAPAAAIAPGLPLVVDLTLGVVPSAVRGAGLVLVIVGVMLTAYRPGAAALDRRRALRSLGYGLVSAAGFGVYYVAMGEASSAGVPWALLTARLTAVAAIMLAALVARARLRVGRRQLPGLALIGALLVAADTMYATATTLGSVSVAAVLSALHPVVTIALAWIFHRERVGAIGQVGVVLSVGGIIAITAT